MPFCCFYHCRSMLTVRRKEKAWRTFGLAGPLLPIRGLLSTAELGRNTTGEAESIEEGDESSAVCHSLAAKASSVGVVLCCTGSVPTTIETSAPVSSSSSSASPSEKPSGPSSSRHTGASSVAFQKFDGDKYDA